MDKFSSDEAKAVGACKGRLAGTELSSEMSSASTTRIIGPSPIPEQSYSSDMLQHYLLDENCDSHDRLPDDLRSITRNGKGHPVATCPSGSHSLPVSRRSSNASDIGTAAPSTAAFGTPKPAPNTVRHSRTLSNEELAYVHAEQALAKVSSTRTGEHAFTLSCASTQPSDTRTGKACFHTLVRVYTAIRHA
jgi:hypothetical protein